MFKWLKIFMLSLSTLSLVPSVVFATPEWYEITISTAPVTSIAGIVLTALAAIWVIRKAIKTTNRS